MVAFAVAMHAIEQNPKFQRCLTVWRGIVRKERLGIALTKEEEAAKWEPRSIQCAKAELVAAGYGFLFKERAMR